MLQITQGFGMDPVYIGVMMVMNLMIGLSTPPFGLCICGLAGCQRAFGEGYQVGGADVHTAGNCADTTSLIPAVSTFVPNTIMSLLAGG